MRGGTWDRTPVRYELTPAGYAALERPDGNVVQPTKRVRWELTPAGHAVLDRGRREP